MAGLTPGLRMIANACVEWAAGYSDRFGCTFIDFESDEKTRYPKQSAYYLDKLFKHLIRDQ